MKLINSLSEIIPNYELFIIDLFGVIHDGIETYPDVMNTIKALRVAEKRIVFLSNAPRRAERTMKTLEKFDIDEECYDLILTSGEHAFYHFETLEKLKYFYIGPEKDRGLLNGTPHEEVAKAADADIAIATGLTPEQFVEDVEGELKEALAANLKLYCINPDKFVHKKDGRSHICAGSVAEEYKDMGGEVEYFGKPYKSIYDEVIAEFDFDPKQILCIGDGLETDIAGAKNTNLDSLLIASGMYRKQLGMEIGDSLNEENIKSLVNDHDAKPTYVTSLFGIK